MSPQSTVPVEPLSAEWPHRPDGDFLGVTVCEKCGEQWPCDSQRVLDAARASRPVTATAREEIEKLLAEAVAHDNSVHDGSLWREGRIKGLRDALAALPVREDEPTGIDQTERDWPLDWSERRKSDDPFPEPTLPEVEQMLRRRLDPAMAYALRPTGDPYPEWAKAILGEASHVR